MTQLDTLKQLVLDGSYDEESRKQVSDLEDRLHKVLVAENLLSNPIIQEYVDYLDTEKKRCSLLLSQDRKLTDLERQTLFEKRDLCDKFTSLFTGEQKSEIETTIKELLNVAKNS